MQQVHDQVEVLAVLEGVVHVHEERIVELGEDLPLVHDGLHGALGDYTGFRHFFHRILMLELFSLYFPNFTEPALADAVEVAEGVLGQRCAAVTSGGLTCYIFSFELSFEVTISHGSVLF